MLARERRTDGVGANMWISIHVTADPRRESQKVVRQIEFDRIHARDRLPQGPVNLRHYRVHDVRQVEEHVLHFVRHARLAEVFVRLPGDTHFVANRCKRASALGIRFAI